MELREYDSNINSYWVIDEKRGKITYRMKTKWGETTGIAKLNEEDVWNEEKGKKIAKYKAIIALKRRQIKNYKLDIYVANLYLTTKSYGLVLQSCTYKIQKELESIQKLKQKIISLYY